MPNSIIVGDTTYSMCSDYIQGALHERVGLKSLFKDTGTEQWKIGARNERNREHLRFDTDILTEQDTGRVFQEDTEYGATEKVASRYGMRFVMSEGNYRRDLLIACGAYHAQGQINEEKGNLSPGEMRRELAERGISISTADCSVLSHLRYREAQIAAAELSADEIEKVENLKDTHRRLLEICSDCMDEDWSHMPESDHVSWRAKRAPGWATSTVLKMQREGLAGFDGFVRATGNGWIEITPKGILAVRHLRKRDAELGQEGLPPAEKTGRRRHW
jgi:hypothetical protein